MVSEPPGNDLAGRVSTEPTVFVCDESPEGERVGAVLRARGYSVADVPQDRLLERISVQQPSLVICEVETEAGLELLRRLSLEPYRPRIHSIAVGERTRALSEHAEELRQLTVSTYERPVDTYALLRRVEALLGAPRTRPSLVPPSRWSAPPDSSGAPAPPTTPSVRPASWARGLLGGDALPRAAPQTDLSPELEGVLRQAETRLGLPSSLPSGAPGRMSPEEELEAVLPAEILAALDEPLDADDVDEEDLEASVHGSSETGRGTSEHGTGGGTGTTNTPLQARGAGSSADTGEATGAAVEPEMLAQPNTRLSVGGPAVTAPEAAEPPSGDPWPAPRFATLPAKPSTFPPVSEGSADHLPTARPGAEPRHTPPDPVVQRRQVAAGRAGPPGEVVPGSEPPTPFPAEPSTTRPPHHHGRDEEQVDLPELPAGLGPGDALRALAQLVRARYTGAAAFEDPAGIHRIVLRDGDFVTAASGIEQESLVAFLVQRGALSPESANRLGRRIPHFGRHAGAALIAHGQLRQDELWPVLRAHAEWLIGHTLTVMRGAVSLEHEVPARLKSEPAVFGGATGAEVLVEVVRRVVAPEVAIERLGSTGARLAEGRYAALLGECGLPDHELGLIERRREATVGGLLETARAPDFAAVLYALVELGVLDRALPEARPETPPAPRGGMDELDEAAQRARILARKALVEDGDYFAVLGVARSATAYDIRRAYLSLKREFEPVRALTKNTADLREDLDLILEVLDEAYDILRDQTRRERYRRALEAGPE